MKSQQKSEDIYFLTSLNINIETRDADLDKISIIIPTLNEEHGIEKTINAIPREELEAMGYQVHVLVVDSNSEDRTVKKAHSAGAEVIFEPKRGKGIAFRTALKSVDAKFIFMLDGDYSYPPEYIPEMLKMLSYNDAVIGTRLNRYREKGSISRLHLVGNYLLSMFASLLYMRRINDINSGYWGFRSMVVKQLNLTATRFDLEAELFISLAQKGCSIAEVPICYRRSVSSSKLNAFRDGIKISWMLIKKRFYRDSY